MGQRLNIEIKNGNKLLANCYYHWSAYTDSALALTTTALDAYSPDLNPVQNALKMLDATGATISGEELKAAQKLMPSDFEFHNTNPDRNFGLISVTRKGMHSTELWSESRVTIDIGAEVVDFGVFWCVDNDDIEEGDSIENLDFFPNCVDFADWDSFKDNLNNISDFFTCIDDEGVYSKIL